MHELLQVLQTDAAIDQLLDTLDVIARNCDPYEYGLPIYADDHMPLLRAAVRRWLTQPQETATGA